MAFKLSFPISLFFFLVFSVLPALPYPHLNPKGLLVNSTDSSPFGFLKGLKGCRKGQDVKGLQDLKLYLSGFGYLTYHTNPNITDPKRDYFDEELEAALKSYQVYYHLNATGTLDTPTLSQMVIPRCGFPDKEGNHHMNGLLHIVSHYTFFPRRQKWPGSKRRLTYGFGPRFPTRLRPAVARAFRKWATASRHFTFSRVRTYARADLKISFKRRDGPGGVLAHAFAPTNGRMNFDRAERWVIGRVPNAHDVESVALHEIGHLLGLRHSRVRNAIMWPSIGPGVTKGLASDDIRGIRALYRR